MIGDDDKVTATPDVSVKLTQRANDAIQLLLVGRISTLCLSQNATVNGDDVVSCDVFTWSSRLIEYTTDTSIRTISSDVECTREVRILKERSCCDS